MGMTLTGPQWAQMKAKTVMVVIFSREDDSERTQITTFAGRTISTRRGRRTSAARRSSHGDYLHDELLGAAFVAGLHGTLLGRTGGADGGAVAAVEQVDGADEREFHDSGLLVAGSARRVGRGIGDVAHPRFPGRLDCGVAGVDASLVLVGAPRAPFPPRPARRST